MKNCSFAPVSCVLALLFVCAFRLRLMFYLASFENVWWELKIIDSRAEIGNWNGDERVVGWSDGATTRNAKQRKRGTRFD